MFRPTNVLPDSMYNSRNLWVIDWEFPTVAPTEFTSDAPWWLLLTHPLIVLAGRSGWLDMSLREPTFHRLPGALEVRTIGDWTWNPNRTQMTFQEWRRIREPGGFLDKLSDEEKDGHPIRCMIHWKKPRSDWNTKLLLFWGKEGQISPWIAISSHRWELAYSIGSRVAEEGFNAGRKLLLDWHRKPVE